MEFAISVKNLIVFATNSLGSTRSQIIKNVSFDIPVGKICVFIGHNGAGKTTTVKSILGLRPIKNGEITIFDKSHRDPTSRLSVGYIPEKGSIENISAKNFLKIIGRFYNLKSDQVTNEINKILKSFDCADFNLNRKLNKLSAGQNKIINIAQAFLAPNKLIIADEPTDNLDPENRDMFWDFVNKYHCEHPETTFFIITHNLDEVEKYADYMIIMDHGEIKHAGPYDRSAGLRAKYRAMRDEWRL
ncbi:MAG: ABC transporter ATP-binding protein [Mycoplasmataceae bacterium]|nr:ABC transporter ATP-binding protein [Mycoplasmataceae bacterium]